MNSKLIRNRHLAPKIIVIDGLPGCGKTMLSPIISALDRVEVMTFSYELEYILTLSYLGKITDDAANTMIRISTDLKLYNLMMSRETNFRPSDLSSIFKHKSPIRYIKRLSIIIVLRSRDLQVFQIRYPYQTQPVALFSYPTRPISGP